MNRIFLVTTAMICLAAVGCISTSEKIEHSEEVKNYRKKIDNFMKTYIQPEYEIPSMYLNEQIAFFDAIDSGVKSRGHIDFVLESAKLIDALYASAARKQEVKLS